MEMVTIADGLVAGWVSHFGVPAVITSDRGTQFTSAVWEVLCKRLNIQHITTTAFHTCSNGMVERCHCQKTRCGRGLR
jgi:transposase InsO family protein